MRFAYYPGCSAKSSAAEYDESARLVASRLGIELVELEGANCCGTVELLRADRVLWLALNARVLSLAALRGLPLATICNGCLLNLEKAREAMGAGGPDAERALSALSAAGAEYSDPGRVTHLLEVVVRGVGPEKLRSLTQRKLSGLKVAGFPGCQLLRPSALLSLDDPERPHLLEDLAEALGAEPVDYAEKNKCCGGPVLLEDEHLALRRVKAVVKSAMGAGADCIVVACPLCHLALDAGQPMASRSLGAELGLPVLYFTQLVGLALGESPAKLGLGRHIVPTRGVVELVGAT